MSTRAETEAHANFVRTLKLGEQVERYISNPRRLRDHASCNDDERLKDICEVAENISCICAKSREESDELQRSRQKKISSIQDQLMAGTRFTDSVQLRAYRGLERYIPRLVNVVTLGLVSPAPGSKTTLPLNLEHIATKCVGAFFAPRRFAAVQLAFHRWPRARVLVFRDFASPPLSSSPLTPHPVLQNS